MPDTQLTDAFILWRNCCTNIFLPKNPLYCHCLLERLTSLASHRGVTDTQPYYYGVIIMYRRFHAYEPNKLV